MSSSRNIIKSRYNKELSSYVSLLEAESAVALADVENAVEEEEQQKESLGMVLPEKKRRILTMRPYFTLRWKRHSTL